jgi:hypothetical protein
LTVMGVTDTDPSIFPGIPLSDATAFKYHVPETYRRHLSIRVRATFHGCPLPSL